MLLVIRDQLSLLTNLLTRIRPLNLPVLIIDDGSTSTNASQLDQLSSQQGIHLIRLVRKSGEGVAIRAGLDEAHYLGYTHVLQHDIHAEYTNEDLQILIDHSLRAPEILFFSAAIVTNTDTARSTSARMTAIAAHDKQLRYVSCGLRVYPVDSVNHLLSQVACSKGKEFGTEILVRWCWKELPCVPYPVKQLHRGCHKMQLRDIAANLKMHLRVLGGMLIRLPWLLGREKSKSGNIPMHDA